MKNARPKRSRFVGIRFTPEEFARIEDAAQNAEVELSAHVRSVLLGVDVPRQSRRKSPDREALGQALVALNRIGNNINQIARQANLTGDVTAYRQAQADRAMLSAAAQAVISAMESSS